MWKRSITAEIDSDGNSWVFSSDGSQQTIRIRVETRFQPMLMPSFANVDLYNINVATRTALQETARHSVDKFLEGKESVEKRNAKAERHLDVQNTPRITLFAGWNTTVENFNLNTAKGAKLFTGYIRGIQVRRAGSDIITRLLCTYTPMGLPWLTQIRQVYATDGNSLSHEIQSMLGEKLKDINIRLLEENDLLKDGKRIDFGTIQQVAMALKNLGIEVYPNVDGILVVSHGSAFRSNIVLDSGTNLISITPHTESDMYFETGVHIQSIFMPRLECGYSVRVNSQLHPALSNTYKVTFKEDVLDTGSNEFITNCFCLYQAEVWLSS